MNEIRRQMAAAAPRARPPTEELLARAERAGLVDVAYDEVDSPIGTLVVATTDKGLVRVGFPTETEGVVLDELARRLSPRVVKAPRKVASVARELDEYFAGRRKRFDVPLDWALVGPYARKVLRATAAIPFGKVSTYREVARKAGNPAASRAAGNALGSNPIPVVVPCHRVLRTNGSLGGYGGGLDVKEHLLRLEGVL
ncbi:MAG TPA: methylated-DNA--[protein]-cysteine S-methyltransferase [Actinomycetota bacterium]|nr:methylated-DNA--[protein]-cysteine S-methyltransferase [Actinomycetota bacterium]